MDRIFIRFYVENPVRKNPALEIVSVTLLVGPIRTPMQVRKLIGERMDGIAQRSAEVSDFWGFLSSLKPLPASQAQPSVDHFQWLTWFCS